MVPPRLSVLPILVLVIFSIPAANAAPKKERKAETQPPSSVEQLSGRLRPSVVVVSHFGRDGNEDGVGAGFVISSNGLIATSLHVIGEARPVVVRLSDGTEHEVTEVHAWDRPLDLAIVRISANSLTPLQLGDSDQLNQGTAVVAMGNPLGLQHSIVQGVVSARRDFDGVEMIQLAMPIEPGNSGGPLVDMQGRVHGLLTLKSALTPNLGFAMPVNELKKLIARPNPVPMSRWLTIGALNLKEWEPRMGARWRQRAGRVLVEGIGKGFGGRSLCLSHKPVPSRPYEVAVSVRLHDESGAAGLVFEADGEDSHYGFYPTAGQLRLTRFDGPSVFSWTILSTTNSPHYRTGEWNHIRVRVEKERLLCFVNERLVIESQDAALKSGRAGLAKFRHTQAEFKEFRIGTNLSTRSTDPLVAQNLPTGPDLDAAFKQNPELTYRALHDEASKLERRAADLRRVATRGRSEAIQNEIVALLQGPERQIDLFHAALLISKLDNPDLDVDFYQQEMDRLAREVRAKIGGAAGQDVRLAKLVDYMFKEAGFHGSRSDYYHRANSHIDRVLDDREGLPITLAVVFLELARRVGLEDVSGAPLPGHFMVRYEPANGPERFIDVFDGGKVVTRDEAERVASEASGVGVEAGAAPATKKEMVIRMLRNLANVAERNGSAVESLRYLDVIVALAPEAPLERLGRAMARLGAGDIGGARADLEIVMKSEPDGVDLRRVRDLHRRLSETP